MKIYRFAVIGIIIVLSLGILSGCTTFENFKIAFIDNPQNKSATIQVGIYEPMTGADSAEGKLEVEGIEMAHELYPNVNGKIIELVYGDNASDIYAAETAIKDIIAKEPAVILGSYGSAYSLAAGDYIKEAKIPAIAITNTNPLVTKNNNYYFRVCYVDSNQGDILARYLLEKKNELTAGIFLPKGDDVAMATATAFTDRMKAETGNEDAIGAYEEYTPGDKDFKKQLTAIKKSGVKSVLLPGEVNDDVRIIKQAKAMNLNVVFLGDTDWATDEFKQLIGSDATEKNVAFVNFFDAEGTAAEETAAQGTVNEEAAKFLKAYEKKHGKGSVPPDSVALGYDAYVIAVNAIDKSKDDATGKQIRNVLAGQNQFKGASGQITFNNVGDPIKTAFISTWKNGEIISLHTIEPN